jgi:CheY-like chemotaxis protein
MTDDKLQPILLVEDEPSDAALLLRSFEKAEVLNPIIHLNHGDDALQYLAGKGKYVDRDRHPLPALILLDLKLPGMTGIQLLQWRRIEGEIRRIPVVVLTTDDDPATVNAAYDLGANSFLVKPGDAASVYSMVKAIQRYWIALNKTPQLAMRAGQQ